MMSMERFTAMLQSNAGPPESGKGASRRVSKLSGAGMSRRKALVTIGKAAAGVAVVAVAAATGLGGYFYYEAQSTGSRTQSVASSTSQSSSYASSNASGEPGFAPLFDGATLDGWQEAGPGGFNVVDGMLQSFGGMGLLWYTKKQFGDFILKMDWKVLHIDDNSGVFLRFPDPVNDPWVAVDNGYEVQIDDMGAPDGGMIHKTGGFYNFAAPTKVATNAVGEWNFYEIHAVGQSYRVILNGSEVTDFTGSRSTKGYVGLQNHNGIVSFRNIRIEEL